MSAKLNWSTTHQRSRHNRIGESSFKVEKAKDLKRTRRGTVRISEWMRNVVWICLMPYRTSSRMSLHPSEALMIGLR